MNNIHENLYVESNLLIQLQLDQIRNLNCIGFINFTQDPTI
ncbi:hypothetical protein pb186bvf_008260 [Paramecium bursaria]